MRDLTRYLPTAVLALLAAPFAAFLYDCTLDDFSSPHQWVMDMLAFVINVPLYSKGISYLQAPLLLAIGLKYYSPRALGYNGGGLFVLPTRGSGIALLLISILVLFIAYSSSSILGYDCGQKNCIRARLISDLSLQNGNVSALLGYCSALIASAFGIATVILVPTPPNAAPADTDTKPSVGK